MPSAVEWGADLIGAGKADWGHLCKAYQARLRAVGGFSIEDFFVEDMGESGGVDVVHHYRSSSFLLINDFPSSLRLRSNIPIR